MVTRYHDRRQAGRVLASLLTAYADRSDVYILALPRGGVPVAYEVAIQLHVPLDVFLVRKLGVPGHEELAMGAIATGGIRVLNHEVIRSLQISEQAIDDVVRQEQKELERREQLYRGKRSSFHLQGATVIIVDDGLATGASMRAAAHAIQLQKPARLIIAVPVAAPSTCEELSEEVDEVICPRTPLFFYGVGWWYDDFTQISDQEVRELLQAAAQAQASLA